MRRVALLFWLLACAPSLAQFSPMVQGPASGASYTGPGDVVSSATAWYGLRGYSAAYAAPGTGKSVNVRRASDNATQDIVILTTGALDIASYNTFVGTDATASCTIAGTSMACTGASATIHVGDPVTGVGITNPCVVTVTNGSTTATASLAGTSTSCGTVGVAETVTFQVAGLITKAYDQSGANYCSGAPCDVAQATSANQPQLLPNCGNSLPCIWFTGSVPQKLTIPITTVAQPFTWSAVGLTQHSTNHDILIAGGNSFSQNLFIQNTFSAGTGGNAGSLLQGSIGTISTLYALQFSANGASSAHNNGGTETLGNSGASGFTTPLTLGTDGTANDTPLTGYLDEAGIWPQNETSTQRNNVCHNQRIYWTTAGSC